MTKQQIVTPLHLDALLKSNAQHRDKHFEMSALGRTCCSRSMNLNNGTGSPVATNRILSLLSPFVVTSASKGEKRATRNHVDVSEATRKTKRGWHVQLELGDVFPFLSQQRQTTKPQHLTTKSTALNQTVDGQIQASIPDNHPCFMALLRALPNVHDPRRWSVRKNATSLMSWSRLSDPSCN